MKVLHGLSCSICHLMSSWILRSYLCSVSVPAFTTQSLHFQLSTFVLSPLMSFSNLLMEGSPHKHQQSYLILPFIFLLKSLLNPSQQGLTHDWGTYWQPNTNNHNELVKYNDILTYKDIVDSKLIMKEY